MSTCGYCGRLNEDEETRCRECGTSLKDKRSHRIGPGGSRSDLVAKFYRTLFELRFRRAGTQALMLTNHRLLSMRVLPALAISVAAFSGLLSRAFAIGFLGGFVLFECVVFVLICQRWPLIRQWIDWSRAKEQADGGPK